MKKLINFATAIILFLIENYLVVIFLLFMLGLGALLSKSIAVPRAVFFALLFFLILCYFWKVIAAGIRLITILLVIIFSFKLFHYLTPFIDDYNPDPAWYDFSNIPRLFLTYFEKILNQDLATFDIILFMIYVIFILIGFIVLLSIFGTSGLEFSDGTIIIKNPNGDKKNYG